jgi:hypothetical protein
LKLLPDHCVPRPLRNHFTGHDVQTTYECGWSAYKNGALLSAAEEDGFTVLVTTDQNLPHRQNVASRHIAVLILAADSNRMADLLPLMPLVLHALDTIKPGQIVKVELLAAS